MIKLTDIQAILLSTAVGRDNGSLLPIPETLADKDEQASKAIAQLIKRALAAEVETTDTASTFREDGDLWFAAVISDAGKEAIGATDSDASGQAPQAEPAKAARSVTKQAKVIDLLQRGQGASLAEMQDATGWLPHTTRAALTGIRKRGLTIEKSKVDGVTRYKAVAAQ